ncbi:hypothetical protein JCM5353_006888 [Sporobolomyces roseus]
MFALKAATRFPTTSSQLSNLSRSISRPLSTDSTPTPPNIHETQSRERERSIRKVSEEGGAHSQLIALAVKNTEKGQTKSAKVGGPQTKEARLEQAKRQMERRKSETKSNDSPSSSPRTPRPSSGSPQGQPRLGSNLSNRRPQQQQQQPQRSATDPISLLRGNIERRPFNPRFPSSSPSGDRPPRSQSSSPRSPRSGPSSKSGSKPKGGGNRRQTSSSPTSNFSAEDTKPLEPPSGIAYPSVNLAQLLRADLAAKALQVKQAVGQGLLDEDAETQEAREHARKVMSGDYSQWSKESSEGKDTKGKGKKAVEHARTLLARNASVGLEGREAFMSKLKEVL